ncbi:MAG TPA: hypothetical protein DCS15_06735 [Flavobacteriales bacterium]|nr:hypothetical protein [Flavobacteriales bacterium]
MYERHQIGCLNRHYLQRTIGVLVATTFFHLCSQISKFKNKRWILRTKAFLKKLKKLQKVQNFDIIHSHLIHADFLMAMFKKFVKEDFKLVSTKHGFQEWYNNKYGFDAGVKKNNFYLRVAKFAEKQMDASIAISKGLRDLYVGLKISKQKRIHLIHYGLDFPEKIELDASKRFWKNQLVLVGRLTAFKGHRYALEALKLVSEKLDDVGLVIVGSGQLEDELKNYTEELGLKNHVNFIGYSPDARSFMFNSDVVLVPSVSEGFGVVVLESFSVKKAIVAFDVPSLNEHIESGANGYLSEAFDIASYSENILSLLNHVDKRTRMGEEGHRRLLDYYCLDRITQDTLAFYENLAESKSA